MIIKRCKYNLTKFQYICIYYPSFNYIMCANIKELCTINKIKSNATLRSIVLASGKNCHHPCQP